MRVLLVKMSSMGDVLHTLPAVTDAAASLRGVRFDWVVEEGLAEIPGWHGAVDRVIPLPLRRWRTAPDRRLAGEAGRALEALRRERYDRVIDAQGLVKSAAVACLARGRRSGYDADSVREPLAAWTYAQRVAAPRGLHAIDRLRLLFAGALGYEAPRTRPDYGLTKAAFAPLGGASQPYLVINHASSWATKSWPEAYWRDLIGRAGEAGLRVYLPWGADAELEQARRLARGHPNAQTLPRMGLGQLASALAHAAAAVSVDTGLGHLAAALGTPAVSIYGATDPSLTGTVGANQHHVRASFACAPCLSRRCTYGAASEVTPACYGTVPPERVWGTLGRYVNGVDR